ncbi:ATP synthase F1 subunit epsilon [Mycoplasmoides pirum]|uniref:ATP synthase F1 subunit epsilon n=1 Tax=Mycoplasmoides pirum TaxID=2122 RepID=UPI00069612AE|nr:ATP synthase F1 subunit epsilon [Mycoplasmoides pirum]
MSDNLVHLKILTPNGIKFDADIKMVEVKTPEGYIALMYNHVPFVATLSADVIYITHSDKNRESGIINTGTIYATKTEIKIFALNFILTKDIDVNKVSEEKKKLEQQLSRINDLVETTKIERKLAFELLKLKQAKK